VRHGAGERGDHARRAGRRAAAAGERPSWAAGGEPQEDSSEDEDGKEGRKWGGCWEEEQEERVLIASGHGEHHWLLAWVVWEMRGGLEKLMEWCEGGDA
jgi:hypothetical protein